MSVSYVSNNPFVSSAPIPSLDLNLMASVLQQKQGQYDANFNKVQSQISNAASLEMDRELDRSYRDSKVNELVKNLNSKVGVDYSDPNVSSDIDGSISNLFLDNRILRAVSSTKGISGVTSSYAKMQSDPKLMKFFSEANYDADMAEVERYRNSKEPEDVYRGKSTATLFQSYMPDLTKAAEKIKADGWRRMEDGTTGYYNIHSKKTVSADKIANVVDILSADQKAQMARDANYLWGKKLNLDPSELIGKINNELSQQIYSVEQDINIVNKLKSLSTGSDIAKKSEQLKGLQFQLSNLKSRKVSSENEYNNYLKNGGSLEGLRFMAYQDGISKSMGKLFSWSEESLERKVDPYQLESAKAINRQNEIILALSGKKELMKLAAELDPDKSNPDPNKPAPFFPNPTRDHTEVGIYDRMVFNNNQADLLEEEAISIYEKSPEIKNYKAMLNGAGKGRDVGMSKLPLNLDEKVYDHNILSFGAMTYRLGANTDRSLQKQYQQLGIDESKLDKTSLISTKSNLVTNYKDLKSIDNFRITNINTSTKQYKIDPSTKKMVRDNGIYATVEVKKGNDWVQRPEQIELNEAHINFYTSGKIKKLNTESNKQDKFQQIINEGVDKNNQFATSIQSKSNPNVVTNISVIEEESGGYEAYIEVDGQAIPISKLGTKSNKFPYAFSALESAKQFAQGLPSKEFLTTLIKNYTPDANLNTKKIKFGNHSIYKKTPSKRAPFKSEDIPGYGMDVLPPTF